jgi:hypothetical protein
MAEFKAALRNLPDELSGEGGDIVLRRADEAAQDIRSAYPEVTGNLKSHVVIKVIPSPAGASAVVKSTAKHAFLYENGSQARHTDIGANRGAMPPAHIFIPMMVRKRLAMVGDLTALLKRAGLEVRHG